MRTWLLAAIVGIVGWPTSAQEPSAGAGQLAAAPSAIPNDALTPHAIEAFFSALEAIREEQPPAAGGSPATPEQEDTEEDTEEGIFACAGDEEPFADLFVESQIERLDEIAQAHGFRDATHWQRIGAKIVAKSAIEVMVKQAKLSEDDLKVEVDGAFKME